MKTITLSSNDRLITKLMVIQDNLEEFLSKMGGVRHRHEKMKREIPWEDIEYLIATEIVDLKEIIENLKWGTGLKKEITIGEANIDEMGEK